MKKRLPFNPDRLKKLSALTTLLVSLGFLCVSSPSIANENIALTSLADSKTNLQAFRDDGKFTLLMIRYHGCEPCNEVEIEMQKWFSQLDAQKVSALIINTDEPDMHDAVRDRVSSTGISIPSFFADNADSIAESYTAITEQSFTGVPAFIFFGPEGDHIGNHMGSNFDWQTLNEMLAASDSGLFANGGSEAPVPSLPKREPANVRDNVQKIRWYLIRGDYQRAEIWIDSLRTNFPDSNLLKIVNAQYLMLDQREADGSWFDYSITDETAQTVESLLLSVQETDPANPEVTSILSELYAIRQELDKSTATMENAADLYKASYWADYNRAIHAFARKQYAEAIEHLSPILDQNLGSSTPLSEWFRHQQAWKLAKHIGDADHTLDPIHIIRDGLAERVLENEVLATLEEKFSSDLPLMLIITSEDARCGPCVDVASRIEPFIRDNKDKYQFLYVSIEPWNQIGYQTWATAIPDITGVPRVAVFARGRFMSATGIPETETVLDWYEKTYPLFLSEDLALFDFQQRTAVGKRNAAYQLWNIQKQKYSAFASVVSTTDYAWGAQDSNTGPQQVAELKALQACRKFAKEKGITEKCKVNGKAAKDK